MKRLFDLFRRKTEAAPAPPRPANFFCLYCNAKFPHDDLARVIAHLKPHRSKEEAEERLRGGEPKPSS